MSVVKKSLSLQLQWNLIAASCASMMCVLNTDPTRNTLLTHALVIDNRKFEKNDVGIAFYGMMFIPYFV
jgi:hypothetical protein